MTERDVVDDSGTERAASGPVHVPVPGPVPGPVPVPVPVPGPEPTPPNVDGTVPASATTDAPAPAATDAPASAADSPDSPESGPSPSPQPVVVAAAPPDARERLWPAGRGARAAFVLLALAVVAWVVGVQVLRYGAILDPWSADGDQPQAVWQYWRYHIAGAFPPGDVVVDYAFVMHAPPLWWAMLAGLSTVLAPLVAAKLLNLIAFSLTVLTMWFVVARRTNAFIGLAAVVLLVRSWELSYIIAGGYARSFGPLLTLLFLHAFLEDRRRLALVLLVVQAALYPSVVLACGLAWGAYTVVKGPMRLRLRRMAALAVVGVLVIGFGKFQDLRAKDWWGSVVSYEEAKAMPVWGPGGRVAEVPLKPASAEIEKHFVRAFRSSGHIAWKAGGDAVLRHGGWLAAMILVPALVVAGWLGLRRRAGRVVTDGVPWQPFALFAAALVAYFLSRALAFKLYIPYRPLQHVWPYVLYPTVVFVAWALCANLLGRNWRATLAAWVLAVAPSVVLFGDGVDAAPATYGSHRHLVPLFLAVQKLPLDAVLAGEFQYVDKTPLFAWHKSYIMKNMAHPFRKGYWAESERRINEMYRALYATKLSDVVAFGEREHVDYFVVNDANYTRLDPRLFEPVRRQLAPVFQKNRQDGFALMRAPASSIVFRGAGVKLVDLRKLGEALARGEVEDHVHTGPPPPPASAAPRKVRGPSPVLAPRAVLKALQRRNLEVDGDDAVDDDAPAADDVEGGAPTD